MGSEPTKERPVLFSDAMVRAILAGTKTQTRRLVKPQPIRVPNWSAAGKDGLRFGTGKNEQTIAEHCLDRYLRRGHPALTDLCPFDADRLWVRECWRPFMEAWDCGFEYRTDGGRRSVPDRDRIGAFPKLSLRFPGARKDRHSDAWRPSIHMPRWASRLSLSIAAIRVERLQDISEADAKAEGTTTDPRPGLVNGEPATLYPMTHRQAFVWLWNSINSDDGEGSGARAWGANPWVWVVSFEVNRG